MDLRKMEEFLSVVDAGQISAAAEALYMSQSSLSKRMAALSRELGCDLYKRTRTGVKLTPSGREFYTYARKAVHDYHEILDRLAFMNGGRGGKLRVGSLPLVTEYGVEDAVSMYWAMHPSIEIDYQEHTQDSLLTGLNLHLYDIVLARIDLIDKSRYAYASVYNDELVLVCPSDHPLADCRSVELSSLRNERFVLLDEKSDLTKVFQRHCVEAGFHPYSPTRNSRHRMILKAVAQKMGIGVLPRRLVEAYHGKGLAIVPLETPIDTKIGFVWLRNEEVNPLAKDFIQNVRAIVSRRPRVADEQD